MARKTQRPRAGRKKTAESRRTPEVRLFAELFKASSPDAPDPDASLPDDVLRASSDPARRIGKYVRITFLGQGGMGEVWKAWDTELGRWVALKILKDRDASELARFRREAQTAARIAHPHIASIYETREIDGKAYIAMQYIEGQTLRQFPRDNVRVLAGLIRDAATALHAAHEQGVIHRDIKPENLMVGEKLGHAGAVPRSRKGAAFSGYHVYILDFGLAKQTLVSSQVSRSGSILGTPCYMSPQQARGKKDLDHRTDIYSLGAMLYELIADRPPFDHPSLYELLKTIVEQEPRPLRKLRRGVDPQLETIVMKCLEKDPGRRYGTAQDLAEDLSRWLGGKPIKAASSSRRIRKGDSRRLTPHASRRKSVRIEHHQSVLLELAKLDHSDLDASFRALTEACARTLGVGRSGIWLFTEDESELVCRDLYRLGGDAHESGLRLAVNKYPRYFKAQNESRVVASYDAVKDPRTSEFAKEYLKPLGIISMMDVAIRVRGKLRGVFCQEAVEKKREWTAEEQQFASSVADLVALALEAAERQRAERELESRTARIDRYQAVLLELAKMDHSDLEASFRAITEACARTLKVARSGVWIFSDDGDELVCRDLYRLGGDVHDSDLRLKVAKYPRYFQAQADSRVVAAADAAKDPRTSEFAEEYLKPLGIVSMMDVAIRLRGRLRGVVCQESVEQHRDWTAEERQFASSVADIVSLALGSSEVRRMEEELARLRRKKKRPSHARRT